MERKPYQELRTLLSPSEQTQFWMDKQLSPFKNDSGYDYDLEGYWKKHGTLTPTASNGHIDDEFKLPNHPTFSTYSRYYTGQPNAINWENVLLKALTERGLL